VDLAVLKPLADGGKRPDAAKQAALAAKRPCNISPFHPLASHPLDMKKLRTGCSPGGKRDPHAAFWLRL
jgi:hypothetical protein